MLAPPIIHRIAGRVPAGTDVLHQPAPIFQQFHAQGLGVHPCPHAKRQGLHRGDRAAKHKPPD
ncbi:hypothetical protein C2134_17265 [Chromobacterium sinusclupearum]|uniref:Uncharacterized protein n=1 Tax=Chromobacterium sinusclupearum TaxID=2077146 RepID=A0A2K4MLD1_9NEIS|nr:hypothetical protein C2134_17265 [Chromobacterium sinusclupearum]